VQSHDLFAIAKLLVLVLSTPELVLLGIEKPQKPTKNRRHKVDKSSKTQPQMVSLSLRFDTEFHDVTLDVLQYYYSIDNVAIAADICCR